MISVSKMMNRFRPWPLFMLLLAVAVPVCAEQAAVSDDALVSSNQAATNFGSQVALSVSPASKSFIKFDLSGLPPGIAGKDVAKATLRLWVNPLGSAGSMDVYRVAGPWSERTITANTAPPLGAVDAPAITISAAAQNNFLTTELTHLVRDGLDGATNKG